LGIFGLSFSCKDSSQDKKTTYFGGKIKNPYDHYVYFLKGEKVIDTAKLNKQNRFLFQFDSISEGLYTFKDGTEFQYVYLQPKDSVLLYLNRWDFDESLVFSGKGAAKNNFLIDVFLGQEKTDDRFMPYYKLDEKGFEEKIAIEIPVYENKYRLLSQNEDFVFSDKFDKLAKVAIYYPFFSKKEYYPLRHRDKRNLHDFPHVSNGFYAFRDSVDINDESLLPFRTYTYYI
jgi:hypothetical protein